MVKRSIEHDLRNKNFGARNGNYERNAVVKSQETKHRVQRTLGDCWQWKATGSVRNETIAVSDTISLSVQKQHSRIPSPRSSTRQNVSNASRTRSPRGRTPSAKIARLPCKDYLKKTCINSFCDACSTRQRVVVGLGRSAHSHIVRLMNSRRKGRESVSDACHDRTGKPGKRSDEKLGRNSSKRQFSDARQLGCVFQDMKPPKSILRKGTDMPRSIQRVKFTKAIARHTKIRDQNPSLRYICPGEPHQRSPNAPKFEDRSQEETEWQEQGAREAA